MEEQNGSAREWNYVRGTRDTCRMLAQPPGQSKLIELSKGRRWSCRGEVELFVQIIASSIISIADIKSV